MQKSNFPNFHKKNILKRQDSEIENSVISPPENINTNFFEFDFPPNLLSTKFDDENYEELTIPIELYNMGRYEKALEIFESRPPDKARFFKNMICTFHGPIGWLLMFNTKIKKDIFLRYCVSNCYYRLKNYAFALEVIKHNCDYKSIYLKAWCQYKLNLHQESKESFKNAINLNPKYLKLKLPYSESEIL